MVDGNASLAQELTVGHLSPSGFTDDTVIMRMGELKGSQQVLSSASQVLSEVLPVCSLHLLRSLQEASQFHLWTHKRNLREVKALAKAGWTTGGRAKAHAVPLQTSLPLYDVTLSLFGASKRGQKVEERGELCFVVLPLLRRRMTRCSVTWVASGRGFRKRACWGQVLNNPAHISGATLKASFIQSRKVNSSPWD